MIPRGFRFAAVEAAVKAPDRLDLGLIACDRPATVVGVFTRNRVVAAPVVVCRERVGAGTASAVLVNAGNANACTGSQGLSDARHLCDHAAKALSVPSDAVLPCSTGVIGAPLPVDRMEAALPALVAALGPDPDPFARSILTTDTFPKVSRRTVAGSRGEIRVLGIAKGAGMIRPDMATMLGFVLTDAAVIPADLDGLLRGVVDRTFNRITVDGDTSTNDTVLALASGAAVESPLAGRDLEALSEAVEGVCGELARMLVEDGEGATKVVELRVEGAADDGAALRIARTVAESPLVKTALHGEDPNWGRIAAALGRSGAYSGGSFHIAFGGVEVVRDGLGLGVEAERAAHEVMTRKAYELTVTLEEGLGAAWVTTCDFSAEYVRINADYRS